MMMQGLFGQVLSAVNNKKTYARFVSGCVVNKDHARFVC